MKKLHYYSLAFSDSNGNSMAKASVYIGYPKKHITLPRIASAKESAGVSQDAVMLSCCYLGKMTEKEMKTGNKTKYWTPRKLAKHIKKTGDKVVLG
jgi:hypothetical protein